MLNRSSILLRNVVEFREILRKYYKDFKKRYHNDFESVTSESN